MSKKVPNRIYIQTEEFEQVHLDRVFSSDTLYFSEDAVETALSKLVIRINSDLFLQGVKSQMNTKATVENALNEMKSCFNDSKDVVPMLSEAAVRKFIGRHYQNVDRIIDRIKSFEE